MPPPVQFNLFAEHSVHGWPLPFVLVRVIMQEQTWISGPVTVRTTE